jgi:hypothetical protein
MRALRMILGLMALCGGTVHGQEPARKSDEYQAAYKQGREEADRELRDQEAKIYFFGLPESLFEHLDKETGLPYYGFGCVGDDKIEGRVDGHNDRITEHIKAHGLPKESFKPWEKELFGLQDYFESRRKRGKPEILAADGPALKSPDGTCSLKPVVKQETNEGRVVKTLALEVSGNSQKPREIWLFANADVKTELFWGPKGSGFAVVASHLSGCRTYMAIDLRRARWLRIEMGPRHERARTQLVNRSDPD